MILVDARIGSIDLLKPLQRLGVPAESTHLEFGDVAFAGRGENGQEVMIGVELKRLGDLISSLRSGRLQGHQLPGLLRAYDHSWLIIEGRWQTNRQGQLLLYRARTPARLSFSELDKQLLTLELRGGLHVRHTAHRRDTLRTLVSLYRWWTDKALDEHKSHLAIYQPMPLLPISQFRQTISTLPGVGFTRSLAAEKRFRTIRRAIDATEKRWTEVEGIGMETARKVVASVTT